MSGRKILVVDDDVKTVELVKLYLERDGHSVITAYDGPSALSSFREHQPNLVVLDVMLPGMDGMTICRSCGQSPKCPSSCSQRVLATRIS